MSRVLATVLLLLLATLSLAAQADIAGRASVIGGDTIEVHGQRIRLFGIDAPESAQLCLADDRRWRCGQQAALALHERIAGRAVACAEKDRDRYGRIVAVCYAGDEDLNAWLVAEGWALAYRWYSTDCVDEEATAGAARKGIWRGTLVPPRDWRRGRRLEATATEPGDCPIKGNISSKGERWFCFEAEAQAAGWRRSRQ